MINCIYKQYIHYDLFYSWRAACARIDRSGSGTYARLVTIPTTPDGSKQDLISASFSACGLNWKQASLAIAGLLLLGLLLAAYVDGYFRSGADWSFWRHSYFAVNVIYMLAVVPVSSRLSDRAIKGMQPLLDSRGLTQCEPAVDRRREFVALLTGFVTAFPGLMLWLGQEPTADWGLWTNWYFLVTGFCANILFVWVVYRGAVRARTIASLCRQDLNLDLFEASALTPFARWSQVSSLAFVGGICVTLPFQTLQTLQNPAVVVSYASVLVAAVLVFFLPLRSIHGALLQSQARKLAVIRANLQKARADLEQYATQGGTADINQLHSRFAAWSLYEEQVKNASTWPFNHKMVRQVLGSTLVPLGLYWLKLAGGMVGRQFLQ